MSTSRLVSLMVQVAQPNKHKKRGRFLVFPRPEQMNNPDLRLMVMVLVTGRQQKNYEETLMLCAPAIRLNRVRHLQPVFPVQKESLWYPESLRRPADATSVLLLEERPGYDEKDMLDSTTMFNMLVDRKVTAHHRLLVRVALHTALLSGRKKDQCYSLPEGFAAPPQCSIIPDIKDTWTYIQGRGWLCSGKQYHTPREEGSLGPPLICNVNRPRETLHLRTVESASDHLLWRDG